MCKDDPSPADKEYWRIREQIFLDRKGVDLLAGFDRELSASQQKATLLNVAHLAGL
jgi:hypothetical protein